jgi:Ni/Co efflux regulator RcnB
MNAIIRSEMISRRKALSLMGLAAAFGLAAAPTVLAVSDAEAQTVGMERRQERRTARHERREERRTARTERREERRTGTNTAPGTTTGAAK